ISTGNGNNSQTSTTVNEGTLNLGGPNSFNVVGSALTIGDGSGGVNADVVRLLFANQTSSITDVTITSSGLLDLNNNGTTIGNLTITAGNIITGTGILGLSGNLTTLA